MRWEVGSKVEIGRTVDGHVYVNGMVWAGDFGIAWLAGELLERWHQIYDSVGYSMGEVGSCATVTAGDSREEPWVCD